MRPKLTLENVQNQVMQTPKGFVVYDDTVPGDAFEVVITEEIVYGD